MASIDSSREVELIQVIRTTNQRRGEGVAGDPVRRITQYWSLTGDLLAEVDDWKEAPDAAPR